MSEEEFHNLFLMASVSAGFCHWAEDPKPVRGLHCNLPSRSPVLVLKAHSDTNPILQLSKTTQLVTDKHISKSPA